MHENLMSRPPDGAKIIVQYKVQQQAGRAVTDELSRQ